MAKDTSDVLGAVIVRAVLSQERIEDRPHLLTSALTGGWELVAEGTDNVEHDFEIGQAICFFGGGSYINAKSQEHNKRTYRQLLGALA